MLLGEEGKEEKEHWGGSRGNILFHFNISRLGKNQQLNVTAAIEKSYLPEERVEVI